MRRHTPKDIIFDFPDESRHLSIVARTAIDPSAALAELKDSIARLDPTLPVQTGTLNQKIYEMSQRPRFSAVLLAAFAGMALVVAGIGVYGLVSLIVGQRTQEIAVRIALGGNPVAVARQVVLEASAWITLGAVGGIVCSLFVPHWVSSLLFGIRPNDPMTLTEAAIALIALGMLAAYIPARRATKVDPMVALRYE